MQKRGRGSKSCRSADGTVPVYAQIDIDEKEQIVWGTGSAFEKSLKEKLVNELKFKSFGLSEDAVVTFLEKTNQMTSERRGLISDKSWNALFAGVDWSAPSELPPYLLLANVPYTRMGGDTGFTEIFLIFRPQGRAIRIECKAQESSGTAEDKIFRSVLELISCGTESWIVHTGQGFKPETLKALRCCVDKENNTTILITQMNVKQNRSILGAYSAEECLENIKKIIKGDIHERCVSAGPSLSAAVS